MVKRTKTVGKEHKAKIIVDAEVTEAQREIRTIEEHIKKLNRVASTGDKKGGFLNPRQVDSYRDSIESIEKVYAQHYDSLERLEKKYQRSIEQRAEKISRAEKNLSNVQGGNKWGDFSESESIVKHYETALAKALEGVDGEEDLSEVHSRLEDIRSAIVNLSEAREGMNEPSEKIGSMHQENFQIDSIVRGILRPMGLGSMYMSISKLTNYIGSGARGVRDQEYSASQVGMKTHDFSGDDARLSNEARDRGRLNQFSALDSLQLQGSLTKGGGYFDRGLMGDDTEQAQRYGRAYGTDPDQLTEAFSATRKMTTYSEGEMYKFAELIAGAVSKSGMKGREEEMLRTTTDLLNTVSTGLVGVNEEQLYSIVKLQSTLSEALPELKGDRGGDLLARMDASIKNGGHITDLLLGKGTEFKGMEGMWELQKLKEEGLGNPENLERILKNTQKMTSSETAQKYAISNSLNLSANEVDALKNMGIFDRISQGDLSIKEGEINQLRDQGYGDLADQLGLWDNTRGRKRAGIDVDNEIVKNKTGKPFERIGTFMSDMKHRLLPDWLQGVGKIGMGVGGIGLGSMMRSSGAIDGIRKYGSKTLFSNIDGNTAFRGMAGVKDMASDLIGNAPGWARSGVDGAKNIGAGAFNKGKDFIGSSSAFQTAKEGVMNTQWGQKVADMSSKAVQNLSNASFSMKELPKSWDTLWKGMAQKGVDWGTKQGGALGTGVARASDAAKGMSAVVPIIGTAIDIGMDRYQNPEHKMGRSVSKGVGGTLGGILGTLGMAALGVGTGGLGLLAMGGAGIAGSMIGRKAGDAGYSVMAGDSDKLAAMNAKERKAREKAEGRMSVDESTEDQRFYRHDEGDSKHSEIPELKVKVLDVDNGAEESGGRFPYGRRYQNLGENPERDSSMIDTLEEVEKEHVVRVIVEGGIDGMQPEHQRGIVKSFGDYFSNLFGSSGSVTTRPDYSGSLNLAEDQIRR